jgi:thioredoxin reductase (NADPH)
VYQERWVKPKVVLYGADWCHDCVRSKRFLRENNVEFEELNILTRPELADEVIRLNIEAGHGPKRRIPVVLVGEQILSEPTNDELATALGI